MLALEHADVFYDKAKALHALSIEVRDEEVTSLIGRNGAGKSTTLKALIGLLPIAAGRRLLDAKDVSSMRPHQMSRLGVAYVPEMRQIFPNLTVRENLLMGQVAHPAGQWTIERVQALFPVLEERSAATGDTLSGGEQQMLAIARALLCNPRVLLLDEPTEGLAPLMVITVRDAIVEINRQGVPILLVEQNLRVPLRIAHRQYIIDNGKIVWQGSTAELLANRALVEGYLGT
ncbi:MAG: ABC transporter ATP-binding protein [Burkholderiaceae bacterium]